jgi:hypothetical protein
VAVGFLAGCGPDQTVTGDRIVARVNECFWSTTNVRDLGRATLQGQRWQDTSLVVNVKDTLACGDFRLQHPTYRVAGNDLALSWSWQLAPGKPAAACACEREITFTLDALPRREYTVRLDKNGR